jgi:SAM-dependent methyltransferase
VSNELPLAESGLIEDLPRALFARGLFHLLFGREPEDPLYAEGPETGRLTPRQLLEWLIDSAEWSHAAPMTELAPSLHYGRGVFIRSLPPARRILDLGGVALGASAGALVLMGYPYQFDDLIVVDLPSAERHVLYQDDSHPDAVHTDRGLVTYRYHSMTDLSAFPAKSFDLVYSGQSIEHVTRRQANSVIAQARRVLKPGGYLALDTPNRRLTRLQQDAFIDPDHKYEYAHGEMTAMLRGNGFAIERAVGINYGGRSVAQGEFDAGEVATKRGLFHEIADCYLLGYVCRRPAGIHLGPIFNRLLWRLANPDALGNRALRLLRRTRARWVHHGHQ